MRILRKDRLFSAGIGFTAASVIAGFVLGITGGATAEDPVDEPRQEQRTEQPAEEQEPEQAPQVTVDDLEVTLRVVDKENFGSAGSLVTVEPDLGYIAKEEAVLAGGFEVTFEIYGDEDGPIVQTVVVEEGGEFWVDKEIVSTPTVDTEVTAQVTDVYYR